MQKYLLKIDKPESKSQSKSQIKRKKGEFGLYVIGHQHPPTTLILLCGWEYTVQKASSSTLQCQKGAPSPLKKYIMVRLENQPFHFLNNSPKCLDTLLTSYLCTNTDKNLQWRVIIKLPHNLISTSLVNKNCKSIQVNILSF